MNLYKVINFDDSQEIPQKIQHYYQNITLLCINNKQLKLNISPIGYHLIV